MTHQFYNISFRLSTFDFRLLALTSYLLALVLLPSCKSDVKAVSGQGVTITIEEQDVSSGFMNYRFSSNKEAYYHVGIIPAKDVPDLSQSNNVKSFMALMLDQAYADYLYWRSDLLWDGTPYVAAFATHSLQYGTVDYNFNLLEPGTEYMIFAFPVNAQTNKPDGRLFTQYASTPKTSAHENDVLFEYRVRDYWDYVYPLGKNNQVLPNVPWVGATIDSVALRAMPEYKNPADYFYQTFNDYILYNQTDRIHFGIYVHVNDGIGDGSSDTYFEEGHTYYSGINLLDGYLSDKAKVIYKFRWNGSSTQLYFHTNQALTTDW